MKDIVVRIGGEGGEGVISCGELLTTALARSNYEVFTFRTYPAEIKGGPAMFQVWRMKRRWAVPTLALTPVRPPASGTRRLLPIHRDFEFLLLRSFKHES